MLAQVHHINILADACCGLHLCLQHVRQQPAGPAALPAIINSCVRQPGEVWQQRVCLPHGHQAVKVWAEACDEG
jgi:hypothetical protein